MKSKLLDRASAQNLSLIATIYLGNDSYHSGIIFKSNDKKHYLLHLAITKEDGISKVLKDRIENKPKKGLLCCELKNHTTMKSLSLYCNMLSKKLAGKKFPYGFNLPKDVFNQKGEVREDIKGLTCATFSVALLDAVNISLLNFDSWEFKLENFSFYDSIRKLLSCETNLKVIESQIVLNPPRIHPLHVKGAVISNTNNTTFDEAETYKKELEPIFTALR